MRKLVTVYDRILDLGALYVAGGIISLLMLIVTADVVSRYSLNKPFQWTVEISELSLIIILVFTISWLLREDGHVRVDVILTRLKPKTQALINAGTYAMASVAFFIITWYGVKKILYFMSRGGTIVGTSLDIPAVAHLIPLDIGLFMFAIEFARGSYRYLKKWKSES